MIINLWSTPRTGSVWYSMWLAREHSCIRITEMFNPHHMNIYRKIVDGKVMNYHQYQPDLYYEEYEVNDGILRTVRRMEPRTRTVPEELEYRKSLLKHLSADNRLIMHNHVAPIDEQVRQYLTDNCDANIYIYRKDRRAQLASYLIAYTTKTFAQFTKPVDQPSITYSDLNGVNNWTQAINGLADRIKKWDRLDKIGKIVAYEDILFQEVKGLPHKQVLDYTKVLDGKILEYIDTLMVEYEFNNSV